MELTANELIGLYNQTFMDGSKNKLKGYFIKCSIPYSEIEDLMQTYFLDFSKVIKKYNNSKIKLETYIWQTVKYSVINYYQAKKHKKNSLCAPTDFTDINISSYIRSEELNIDLDFLLDSLPDIQRKMLKLMIEGYNQKEILEILELKITLYNTNLAKISKVVGLYCINEY